MNLDCISKQEVEVNNLLHAIHISLFFRVTRVALLYSVDVRIARFFI